MNYLRQRANYVLCNEEGGVGLEEVIIILVVILVAAGFIAFKDQILAFLTRSTGRVGQWESEIQ